VLCVITPHVARALQLFCYSEGTPRAAPPPSRHRHRLLCPLPNWSQNGTNEQYSSECRRTYQAGVGEGATEVLVNSDINGSITTALTY
jgi:hypothetical protein